MRIRRWLPLLALPALAAIGLWAGWFRVGFSASELAELERGWAELHEWARIEGSGPSEPGALERIGEAWSAAESESERSELLARFLDTLAGPAERLPADGQTMLPLLELSRRALAAEGADADRTERLLVLARDMQRRGHLLTFLVGTSLANEVLERCREDDSLIPATLDAPPPRPAELFEALCRDHFLAGELWARPPGSREHEVGGLPPLGGDDEHIARAMRAALLQDARRVHPLRDEPERFGELPLPELPGPFVRLRAACLGRPEDLQALLAPLLTVNIERFGRQWSEFVRDWRDVLGG
ncbi:MAG: hypothetical protein CMJ84_06795 [Planctomycetes bacterium]|jgi:hypothetical protein|nr:hypothetical protein [Planctomycetota bacterium]MDP6408209.1 hypothetical protein [Planctomycetota bacterium]